MCTYNCENTKIVKMRTDKNPNVDDAGLSQITKIISLDKNASEKLEKYRKFS